MGKGFALSAPQTAIWLDHVFFSDKPIYNTGQTVTINGPVDRSLFGESVRILVQECDALRLNLAMEGDTARQTVRDMSNPEVEWIDLSTSGDPLSAARDWIEEYFWIPLAWNDAPLFRFAMLRLSETSHIWVQKYHHLVIDAIGRQLVANRVAKIYDALLKGVSPQPSSASPFASAVNAEEAYLGSDRYAQDRDYWLKRFSTLPNPLIEGDRRQTDRGGTGRPGRLTFEIGRGAFARLDALAHSQGSTIFKLIVAVVYSAFSRLYDSDDIAFGIPLSNRTGKFKETIGLFAQVMPFRIAIDRKTSFADALGQIDKVLTKDYAHRRFPIATIGSLLHLSKLSRFGLYDVSINYVPTDYAFDFAGAAIEVANISSGFFTPWAITIADLGAESGLSVTIDYDRGLISRTEAIRLSECLQLLLIDGIEDVARPIAHLAIMSALERERILRRSRGSIVDVREDATLASLFAEEAARSPRSTAVVCGTDEINYATLYERASSLASRLVGLGVGPNQIVAIALPRSIDLVVAVLGVHLAGGAYLPLDMAHPAERTAYMIEHAQAEVIVTKSTLAAKLPQTGAHLLLLDQPDKTAKRGQTSFFGPARPEDLAYVIYTSGSTGKPKGVAVEHRNVVNLVCWARAMLDRQDLSGVLFSVSLSFDVSVYEFFTTLLFGGCLIVVDSLLDVIQIQARDRVRLITTVPSLLDTLLKAGGCPPSVRTVVVAGEPLSRQLANRLFDTVPHVRFLNCYGPTETTVFSTWYPIDPADRRAPAIGKGLWNTSVYVLDRNLELVPDGAKGELYIGGMGVARGYFRAPELTDERFIANPYEPGRLYRTGDVVRMRDDGELEFIGRADGQVKINGLRVELGEIEAQLEAFEGILSAACAIRPDRFGVNRLIAYAIARSSNRPSFDSIRGQLERRLPRHMVPVSLAWLDSFPLTPSGKLDRRALPPLADDTVAVDYVPPANDIEERLAAIWQQLLKQQQIGVNDDFFDAGGDSLQATLLILKIKDIFGVMLPAEIIFGSASTIAGMAKEIEHNRANPNSHLKRAPNGTTEPESGDVDVDFVEFKTTGQAGDRRESFYVDPRTGLRRARPNAVFKGIQFNGQGYRGPESVLPKPSATLRIAFLGSSRTFDTFITSDKATWPHLTNDLIGRAFPNITVDYVNGALPGFNTRHLSILFREYVAPCDPDAVIIMANDLTADATYLARKQGLSRGPHFIESSWAKRYRPWRWLEKNATIGVRLISARNSQGKLRIDPFELTAAFEERLERLVRECRQKSSFVALITITARLRRSQSKLTQMAAAVSNVYLMPFMSIDGLLDAYDAYDEAIRRVAERTGALVIEAADAVPGDSTHFVDSGHFREPGSRRMSAWVAAALINHPDFRALAASVGVPARSAENTSISEMLRAG